MQTSPRSPWRALALLGLIMCLAAWPLAACDSGGDGGGGDGGDGGAETGGAETGGVETGGVETGGAETGGAETGADEPDEELPPPDWSASMSAEELTAIAEQLGLYVPQGADHGTLIALLEDATGCGCFGAICGVGACDHDCGGDSCLQGQFCYAGTCDLEGSCPMVDLAMSIQETLYYDNGQDISIRYTAVADTTWDVLDDIEQVRMYSRRSSKKPLGPGTYSLRTMDPSDCELCLVAYRGCSAGGCQESFFADLGWVELDEASANGAFRGTIREAKFQKVEGDPMTGAFAFVPQAETICVPDFPFEGPVVSSVVVDPSSCSEGGDGIAIGSKIEDFTAINCLGEEVDLYDYCGSEAIWIVAAAGW